MVGKIHAAIAARRDSGLASIALPEMHQLEQRFGG